MKNWKEVILAVVFLFIGGVVFVNAQDLIILRDGNVIEARVLEISPSEIRYKRFNNLDDPTIVLPTANVVSIRYENGTLDFSLALNAGYKFVLSSGIYFRTGAFIGYDFNGSDFITGFIIKPDLTFGYSF